MKSFHDTIVPYFLKMTLSLVFLCATVMSVACATSSNSSENLWNLVRAGRAFIIMRHAIAPGTGDPDNFVLGDCLTQRNLSDAGRRQAEAIGKLFRENGIDQAEVFSSQWCRCLETARLLKLGPVQELPDLNSFFQRYERRNEQTREMREWLLRQTHATPLVLVTHQVNITALTGFYPSSGELVFARRTDSGEIEVLGSIKTN